MELRQYLPSDCEALADVFYRSVHAIDRKHYSAEELGAWADGSVDAAEWNVKKYLTLFHILRAVSSHGGLVTALCEIGTRKS